ncbi:arsinothricin resistance N-acetyltransferase ArsN1 [Thermomicrobiaceae bacterium CFH 74404]|uniref:Arsinothricin resistance N-acetyltransferase ArsN1 n=1 Tax=Thermalbibacter longus TaxID=2951981 RepID=A0AA41WB03_9BACT|nr:arsinothricin resistance N-acetyltransferase ArsN1 family A [Thermalbibacter longus]MCM8749276.1 arsinothricin resistance N-acetyltransferase ArsN1 [Thermalbibacter longus]
MQVTANELAIRRARPEDAAAIAEIYTQGILERIATFESEPRTPEVMLAWLAERDERHPVLVAERDGRVLGWASISSYRPRACYAGVGEFSIYLHRDARGQGIGKVLLGALIDEVRRLGYWKLLSRVFPFNTASRRLCAALGFREVGVYEKHAKLDGRWLDVVIVERLIPENLT